MTNQLPDIRIGTLTTNENGISQKHVGEASQIFKLPISEETAQLRFAAILVDDTLPKKRKIGSRSAVTRTVAALTTAMMMATMDIKARMMSLGKIF